MDIVRVGHINTSRKDQNSEPQRKGLLAADCEELFEEKISSRKAGRPKLQMTVGTVRGHD